MQTITNDWNDLLAGEQQKPYFHELMDFVHKEYAEKEIYPPEDKVYNALNTTSFSDTKVVILGQDPYHGPNQAHGLSFSVASTDAKFPPSLRNIFKELESDVGVVRTDRDLTDWAEQGVLLLNTVLTVEAKKAASHQKKGWENFTNKVIEQLNKKDEQVIFVLWGGHAQKKEALITNPKHKIIKSVHPSPLSAYNGFFGSKPFSRINRYLSDAGLQEIIWG
ncbi:uracil-DNA glycosylase [Listeria ilorinensis]|uniref:uracil-DNA glycosylase n=1 Tax=Listeria ilorinensis TaxID=2867439 RepID=UPI001EF73FC9|nr:uracil-DNA glycosylase [Listeria ilorinensis]